MCHVFTGILVTTLISTVPGARAQTLHPVRLDRYGDPLSEGAIARLGTDRYRGEESVATLCYSPDGRLLASASGDMAVRVWDVVRGRERYRFVLGWGPDGRPLPRDKPVWPAIAFAPDGRTLAGSGGDHTVRLWDTATGRERFHWASTAGAVAALAFSPDGKTLAGAGADGSVRVWDTATGRQRRSFRGHAGKVRCVAFAPDGKTLASGGIDSTLRLWDLPSGKERRPCKGHAGGVRTLLFLLGGTQLASLDGENAVRLWDVAGGREVRRLTAGDAVYALARGRKGRSLIVVADRIQTWDLATGKTTSTIYLPERPDWLCAELAPDGKTLAVGGSDTAVDLLHYPSGELRRHLGGGDPCVYAVAFAPGGKLLATGTGGCGFYRRGNAIHLWDVATARELRRLEGQPASVRLLAFSPDGRLLASAGADKVIRLWDPATGKELHRCAGHQGHVEHLAFAPDGKTLASAGQDQTVRLWDVATGRQRASYRGHQGPVWGFTFAPGRNVLATRSDRVCVWDLDAGRERTSTEPLRLVGLWYAPNGRLLALEREPVNGDTLALWDVALEKKVRTITLPPSGVGPLALAVAPDGRSVATARLDPEATGGVSIHLWEVATGQLRRRYQGHENGGIEQLTFAPDGRLLASASSDGTALVWAIHGTPGHRPAPAPTARRLRQLWDGLAASNAETAFGSMQALLDSPEAALALLREKVPSFPRVTRGRLARLIADLDSDEFAVREKAAEELRRLGEAAEGGLRQALENRPTLEVRRRVELLLKPLDRRHGLKLTSERLRLERALEVLEHLHTPSARRLLEGLAKGEFEAPLTYEARLALRRLPRR